MGENPLDDVVVLVVERVANREQSVPSSDGDGAVSSPLSVAPT